MKKLIVTQLLLAGLLAAADKGEVAPQLPSPSQIKALNAQIEKLAKEQPAAKPVVSALIPAARPIEMENHTFGEGMPVIRCAPLRVCSIELQAGEKVTVDSAVLGDTVRWIVLPIISGTPPNEKVLVTVKPKMDGLDTNLIITTNKRAYFIRLVSTPDIYVARTTFDYPEEAAAAEWKKVADTQAAAKSAEPAPAPLERHGPINCAYEVKAKKGSEALRPVRVCDQDGKVRLTLPASIRDREAPVLMVRGEKGKDEQVNWRPVGQDIYEVDGLVDRAVLVSGVGKNQRRVDIVRKGA